MVSRPTDNSPGSHDRLMTGVAGGAVNAGAVLGADSPADVKLARQRAESDTYLQLILGQINDLAEDYSELICDNEANQRDVENFERMAAQNGETIEIYTDAQNAIIAQGAASDRYEDIVAKKTGKIPGTGALAEQKNALRDDGGNVVYSDAQGRLYRLENTENLNRVFYGDHEAARLLKKAFGGDQVFAQYTEAGQDAANYHVTTLAAKRSALSEDSFGRLAELIAKNGTLTRKDEAMDGGPTLEAFLKQAQSGIVRLNRQTDMEYARISANLCSTGESAQAGQQQTVSLMSSGALGNEDLQRLGRMQEGFGDIGRNTELMSARLETARQGMPGHGVDLSGTFNIGSGARKPPLTVSFGQNAPPPFISDDRETAPGASMPAPLRQAGMSP